ncbi:MAG: hypothetical protein M0038_15890 [Pseudomonadota bacterium]|jgi:hypothetical protein|nr:hypothetical protein [Pseudomonadota bacterium]
MVLFSAQRPQGSAHIGEGVPRLRILCTGARELRIDGRLIGQSIGTLWVVTRQVSGLVSLVAGRLQVRGGILLRTVLLRRRNESPRTCQIDRRLPRRTARAAAERGEQNRGGGQLEEFHTACLLAFCANCAVACKTHHRGVDATHTG